METAGRHLSIKQNTIGKNYVKNGEGIKMKSRELHRKIKKTLEKLEKETQFETINITEIAESSNIDTRTVKLHLSLMEEDGLGIFCDKILQTFRLIKKGRLHLQRLKK